MKLDPIKVAWREANPDKVAAQRARITPEQHRRYQVKHLYGLTPEDSTAILESQDGVCRICPTDIAASGAWYVDHDHSCCPGKRSCGECVRGFLCRDCNTALGLFSDDVERLRSAIAYLNSPRLAG